MVKMLAYRFTPKNTFINLVHKTVFSPYLLPPIFHNYFTPTSSIHRYETRHNKLYLTHVNTRFGQRILRYKETQLWNRLPNNLSNNTASQSFRNTLKLLLMCDPNRPTVIKTQDVCILDLLLIVYVLVFVLALELHLLMLVSAPVSFLFFLCINICVVFLFRRPVLMSVMLLW